LFARSSESRRDSVIGQRETEAKAESQKQRGHGPREQPELPVIERAHELDAPDQICTSCGGALAEMDGHFEESEEVDVVERR
jgi:transposase